MDQAAVESTDSIKGIKKIELAYSTRRTRIDNTLRGIIGFGELAFPNRIRGYFLQGSYANGDATSASDIDVTVLFKDDFLDQAERERAWQIDTCSEWLVGRALDVIRMSEATLAAPRVEDAVAVASLKEGSRFLYGEDIRPQITLPETKILVRSCRLAALRAISRHHHNPTALTAPLGYPKPQDEFYGFNQRMHGVDGERRGTEPLVYSVVRIAGAIVAAETGKMVFTKRSAMDAFGALPGNPWGAFATRVLEHCHDTWRYRIPRDSRERKKLRRLYPQALDLENDFLLRYQNNSFEGRS